MQNRRSLVLFASILLAPVAGCDKGTPSADAKAEAKPSGQADEAPSAEATPAAEAEPAAKTEAPEPAAKIGAPAPDFTLNDLDGNEVKLSSFQGKTVVLEWFNPGCPFVKFAHGEGPLKTMGNERIGDDLVWLAINSGGPGKQGHGVEANKSAVTAWDMKYPVLIDESGEVGHLYGAQKTPHVFVIDGEGVLRYMGALDNAPIGDSQNDPYKGLLDEALKQLAAGAEVDPAETAPYGCSVKYGA